MSDQTSFTTLSSPVGALTLVAEGDDLVGLFYAQGPIAPKPDTTWVQDDRRLRPAVRQLEEYFAGKRTRFDLPLAPRGTAFQKAVWNQLLRIPFGETATYGEIARAVGKPAACRAVGGANHHNPLSIVIPCHRVIGADGSMTGYGGQVSNKRLLLELEAVVAGRGPLILTPLHGAKLPGRQARRGHAAAARGLARTHIPGTSISSVTSMVPPGIVKCG